MTRESSVGPSEKIPTAPSGVRQRDFTLGWRACEEEIAGAWAALERATTLAELYGEAIVGISEALPNVTKVRVILAGLDTEREQA